jgi:polysaccharide biosynthesis protein PslH
VRVLYICHRIPYPPNKGEKIRAFHQLRGIASRHEVDLFTLADQPEDLAHRPALQQYCREVTVAPLNASLARLRSLPYLFTRTPLTIPCFDSAELHRAVRSALARRSYDRIFVYCSAMAQYAEGVGSIPILTDLVDVDSDKWLQYATSSHFPFSAVYRREGLRLRDYERKICQRSARVLVTTEREASLAREVLGINNVDVVSNGVDGEYFSPTAFPPNASAASIIFTGDMSYRPNEDAAAHFALQVFPLVRRVYRDARFLIVGRNPTRKTRRLSQVDGVEVTGFVPDVRTYLAKAHVAVAPFLIAAGIQNKILEAMAYGLPVVATSRTTQGLCPIVADMVDTGDTAEEMAARVVLLLRDCRLAHSKGIDGRQRVAGEYKWAQSLDRLLELLENPTNTILPSPKTPSSCC